MDAYGLSDIVQQRRMTTIERRGAFKRVSIGNSTRWSVWPKPRIAGAPACSDISAKTQRRRMRNCGQLPVAALLRDGKVIAQKLLSCAIAPERFGAMHLIDVLVAVRPARQTVRA